MYQSNWYVSNVSFQKNIRFGDKKTDILIIGGGIAGCIAAISLIDTYQVTLVDKLPDPIERIGESLAPASQRILKQLDLLEGLENQAGTLYQKKRRYAVLLGKQSGTFCR